jgi:hypothetical protein
VRRRRGVLEFGNKEVKTLLTGPASLEIRRLPGLESDTWKILLPRAISKHDAIRARTRVSDAVWTHRSALADAPDL